MRFLNWPLGKFRLHKGLLFNLALTCVLLLVVQAATAQTPPLLASEVRATIDDIAKQALAKTGVPSASISIVKDGKIAYVHAYGDARLKPQEAAQPGMRYAVGSISKQFTAAAILMLVEEGKVSLDDPVSKFVPGLMRGNEVTIRELLSHTSGYQDYYPQDYLPVFMVKGTTAQEILDRWARRALDFDPGTKWQYSNTNYVIAGLVVEKASGLPLFQFLGKRVFTPLAMASVADIDQNNLPPTDASGYFRYGLGQLRLATKEGNGWLAAAGELAMTAEDLAKWNISMIQQSLLKPASYRLMETQVPLKDGGRTGYGLGLTLRNNDGHRMLEHGGEVSGFTSDNIVLPDDGIAVTVLTNQDNANAAAQIGKGIATALLGHEDPPATETEEDRLVRKVLDGLQRAQIDHSLFTDDCNAYFSESALKDYAGTLSSLGTPKSVKQASMGNRGGLIFRLYTAKFPARTLDISIFQTPDGKFEQFLINLRD
jgi:D-alanyl-D-alanine carboxypeptidase